jgi:hypothetical protein
MWRICSNIARQRLGKHPETDVHATIDGRPIPGYAQNTRTQQQEVCFLLLRSSQRTNGKAN